MDLRRLNLLMHVADYGSFSKSAAVLGMTQPALGRQIQKLEEDCGVRLFYRHGRGVSLTPQGQELVLRAKPLLRELESIAVDLRASHATPQGTVVLGLTPTLCELIGVRLLSSLTDKYPNLTVNVLSGYSGYVHEWLVDGRLDLAVVHDVTRSRTVRVDPVGIARLYLITPKGQEPQSSNGRSVSIADLAQVPLVLSSDRHGLRRTLELAASEVGASIQVKYEVDTLHLALDLVQAGLASAVLARAAYRRLMAGAAISELELVNPILKTRLMIAEAVNRPTTRGVWVVRQEILSVFEELTRTEGEINGLMSLP